MVNIKSPIFNIAIPLAVGGISSILTRNSMEIYASSNQPSFAPPGFLFPIVWTILYILMGISSYLILRSKSDLKFKAMATYALQLFVNFIWPLIFFNARMYLFAFVWLIILLILVLIMTILFHKINKIVAYFQIPYILWLIFASILNFNVYLLN